MPFPRTPVRRRVPFVLAPIGLAMALVGCSGDAASDDVQRATVTESPSATTSTTPAAEPTTGVTSTGPSPRAASPTQAAGATPPPTDARRTLRQQLATADRLPGLNESFRWRAASTSRREPEPFTRCHPVPLRSIGTSDVAVRSFRSSVDPTARAAHAVHSFPDEETARRAFSVLGAWRDSCAERFQEQGEALRVDPVSEVARNARWYLTIGEPNGSAADTAGFEATGFVRVEDRIAVLMMRNDGQDYNYPVGEEPMVAALQQAAALLR